MSKYAIIQIGTFQYNVDEGKEYSVPNFQAEAGKTLKIENVLAVGDGEKFVVGTPNLPKAIVELEILEQAKGEKVHSRIFKAKSRYRRTRGFRKRVTKFKVLSIKY
jgi:large subunit ribosomal protein L21